MGRRYKDSIEQLTYGTQAPGILSIRRMIVD